MPPLVTLSGVSKTFATKTSTFTALKRLDLTLNEGEHVALIGRSGSGKSTLLNLICGIDHPSEGRIHAFSEDLGSLDESALATFRGAHIGIVFQFFQLIPTLTVLENVVLAMDFVGRTAKAERVPRGRSLLARMGLEAHAQKLPSRLSGGEQQRVAIARALANDPPLLVADEPTGNLDSQNAAAIHELFAECVAEGRTVLVATHEREHLDGYDRVLQLEDGVLSELQRV